MDNNITILLGILLTTSEILPYIKQIKGNGILEAFVEIVKVKAKSLNSQANSQVQANSQETVPLLENDTYNINDRHDDINYLNQKLNFSSNLNENLKKENDDVNITINSENVFIKLNTVTSINYV